MAKRKSIDKTMDTASERRSRALNDGPARVTEHDVARRAYELYVARGREDGDDFEDWLQAEEELRGRLHPTA